MCNLCVGLGEKGFISAEKSRGSNYRAGDGGYTRWLIKVGTFVVLLIYFYLISILFSFSSLSHLLLFPFSSSFLSSPLPPISFQFLDSFKIKSRPTHILLNLNPENELVKEEFLPLLVAERSY
jgi:hypothetical protein